jgi:hypothetical protein
MHSESLSSNGRRGCGTHCVDGYMQLREYFPTSCAMDVAVHLESRKMEQSRLRWSTLKKVKDCEWTAAGTEPRVPYVA